VSARTARAALPTAAERAAYRQEYADLIAGLKQAGSRGMTYEQARRLYPALGIEADTIFTVLGRVSGAVSNRWWSVREVGAWFVRGTDGLPQLVFNMGPVQRTWFGLLSEPASLLRPRVELDILGHLGHTHPLKAKFTLSRGDIRVMRAIYGRGTGWQPLYPVIIGPTGQWRHVQDLAFMLQFYRQ
jgi:hypothetical protein